MTEAEVREFPLTVLIQTAGEFSIGAAVTAREATAGAVINVVATTQNAEFSTDPIIAMHLRNAVLPGQKEALLSSDGVPMTPPLVRPLTPAEEELNRHFLDEFERKDQIDQGPSAAALTLPGFDVHHIPMQS
jgi:hypothetical protein